MIDKKELLLKALARTVQKKRGTMSITQLAMESEISKSILSVVEKGKRDIQLSTFIKLAEALYLKPTELLSEIEKELGEDFSFLEQ